MSDSPQRPAYVLWVGPTGLNIVRSLGRAGIPVVGLHHDSNEPSVGTRYARMHFLPALEADEGGWLKFLLAEGKRLAPCKGVLMCAADAHWLFVARHRQALAAYFDFTLPDGDDLAPWMGKPFQYAAAQRTGVPFPKTVTPRDLDDVMRVARDLCYPCLVKPVLSHLWQREYNSKLAFARTPDELIERSRDALSRGLEIMLQEYIPATDDQIYGVWMCISRAGRPLACCVARKLRQFEPRFGSSCLSEIVDEPKAVELGLRIALEMGFKGIGSAEFKRDPRDRQFKLMEFNVRSTLLMGLAADGGVNLPLLAYRDLCGHPPPPALLTPRRFGRRLGMFARDYQAARFYRQVSGLSRLAWLRSWRRARDIYFAWDDWAPFRGYMHGIIDHWRRGKLRSTPENFPSLQEWRAGKWDGRPLSAPALTPPGDIPAPVVLTARLQHPEPMETAKTTMSSVPEA